MKPYLEINDNPITESGQDSLGRSPVAHEFARSVRELDAAHGLVVGVMGPWGHGKSSFVNLMREEFEQRPRLTTIDFNPWMFSGTQQLVDHFFRELASSLRDTDRDKFGKVANWLDEYGEDLSSVTAIGGKWATAALAAARIGVRIKKVRNGGSATEKHKQIANELRDLDEPVVVVIDDIDRLATDEIRDVFKLVRLTASFPNLIYVLAFDRDRVEHALDEINVPGRAYLEKIVQLSFDVPAVPRDALQSEVTSELNRILKHTIDEELFATERWGDILMEIVMPLLSNMRDVTRFAMSAKPTFSALGRDIQTVDLIALESIRVFRPELFAQLRSMRLCLTQTASASFQSTRNSKHQASVVKLLEIAGSDREIVESLLQRVFPAATQYVDNLSSGHQSRSKWRQDHRVAHADFLSMYFDRLEPKELKTFRNANVVSNILLNSELLETHLDAMNSDELSEMMSMIEVFEEGQQQTEVVNGISAFLNRTSSLTADTSSGLFAIRPAMIATRVALRLFRQLTTEETATTAAREILDRVISYSDRLNFLHMIGHREGVGHKLVSQQHVDEMEKELAAEITSTPPRDVSKEWDLWRVLHFAAERTGTDRVETNLRDPDTVRALLLSVRSERRSQFEGTRHVGTQYVLSWELLLEIAETEDQLRAGIASLRERDGESTLVALAERYANGWRPEDD